MPYLFAVLVLANFALFGFYNFVPASDTSLQESKANLQVPVKYINSSDQLPPLVGKK